MQSLTVFLSLLLLYLQTSDWRAHPGEKTNPHQMYHPQMLIYIPSMAVLCPHRSSFFPLCLLQWCPEFTIIGCFSDVCLCSCWGEQFCSTPILLLVLFLHVFTPHKWHIVNPNCSYGCLCLRIREPEHFLLQLVHSENHSHESSDSVSSVNVMSYNSQARVNFWRNVPVTGERAPARFWFNSVTQQ